MDTLDCHYPRALVNRVPPSHQICSVLFLYSDLLRAKDECHLVREGPQASQRQVARLIFLCRIWGREGKGVTGSSRTDKITISRQEVLHQMLLGVFFQNREIRSANVTNFFYTRILITVGTLNSFINWKETLPSDTDGYICVRVLHYD